MVHADEHHLQLKESSKMDLEGMVKAVCQSVQGSETVPDEMMSDALATVWDDDSLPLEVQAWINKVVRTGLATIGRRDRRCAARHASLEVVEANNQHSVGRFFRHCDPVVDAAAVKELRTVIARDDFEKEAVAALVGEHPEYKDFGEFARKQKYCSKAHAYKRLEPIRHRLRESRTA